MCHYISIIFINLLWRFNSCFWSQAESNNVLQFSLRCPAKMCHITSNDRTYGCPIIFTYTYSQSHFVHWHLNSVWYTKTHSLIWALYLVLIASTDNIYSHWFRTELMNRFSCAAFADWLERNYMDSLAQMPLTEISLFFCHKVIFLHPFAFA